MGAPPEIQIRSVKSHRPGIGQRSLDTEANHPAARRRTVAKGIVWVHVRRHVWAEIDVGDRRRRHLEAGVRAGPARSCPPRTGPTGPGRTTPSGPTGSPRTTRCASWTGTARSTRSRPSTSFTMGKTAVGLEDLDELLMRTIDPEPRRRSAAAQRRGPRELDAGAAEAADLPHTHHTEPRHHGAPHRRPVYPRDHDLADEVAAVHPLGPRGDGLPGRAGHARGPSGTPRTPSGSTTSTCRA